MCVCVCILSSPWVKLGGVTEKEKSSTYLWEEINTFESLKVNIILFCYKEQTSKCH